MRKSSTTKLQMNEQKEQIHNNDQVTHSTKMYQFLPRYFHLAKYARDQLKTTGRRKKNCLNKQME